MDLKKIAEISPLIVGFLIFLGFFKLDWYYEHWNINISQYLDFSEILLSFLQDLNIMLFFIMILAAQATFGFMAISSIDKKAKENLNESQIEHHKGIADQLSDHFEKNKKGSLIFLLILTVVFSGLFLWLMSLPLLYLAFLMFVQLVAFVIDELVTNKQSIVDPVTLIITFLAFTFCIAKYEINQTEKHYVQYEFTITDGSITSTNPQLIFIGKTNNYVFLYNNQNCTSKVMKTENISAISIK